MRGHVNEFGEPIVQIGIPIGKRIHVMDAVIDTGFNSYVSIPEKIIKRCNWQCIGDEAYELANGATIHEKVYLGKIVFAGQAQRAYIVSTKADDILIGTKLLKGMELRINFKTNKIHVTAG